MKKLLKLMLTITISITISCQYVFAQETDSFTDNYDGHIYKSVKINNQWWMAENLARKTNNGCWSINNDEKSVSTYGYLYNWETASKECPDGWHLPSDAEWKELVDFLGGNSIAGSKLKEAGQEHWLGNKGATNSSGFTALPAGERSSNGYYAWRTSYGNFWTSTETDDTHVWYYKLSYTKDDIVRDNEGKGQNRGKIKECAFSVRCVKNY